MKIAFGFFRVFLLFWLLSCQNNTDIDQLKILAEQTNTQDMNNERFDIRAYEKRKAEGTTEYKLEDGTLVQQFEVGKGENINYIEYRTPPRPAVLKSFMRFYSDGKLKIKGQKFPADFNCGVWKEYSNNGELIKQTDYDEPYDLTLDDFLSIVRSHFEKNQMPQADLFDNRTTITRQEADQEREWIFSWEATPGRIEMLKFSDASGKLLNESFYELQDN